MQQYYWTSKISVGVHEIDEQHKYLIQILNTLGDEINNITKKEVITVLQKLQKYAKVHFAIEEKLMKKYNCSSLPMNTHIEEHKYFIKEISHLMSSLAAESPTVATEIYIFLGNWLVFHIVNTDAHLAQIIDAADK